MAKIKLNADEFSWLARYTSRRSKVYDNLSTQEQKKLAAITEVYKSIESKLNSQPSSDASLNIELPFNRRELRVIQEAIISTIARVNSKEIPEYQKRIAKGQQLQSYIKQLEALVVGLTEFLSKVGAAL